MVVVDSTFFILLWFLNKNQNLFFQSRSVSAKQLQSFLNTRFDPVLGWDINYVDRNNLGTRGKKDYPEKENYKIKMFGDSFTFGNGVRPSETISSYVEEQTIWDCLNYGTGAFGTDQAYLKYQLNEIPTEYTILGILCENIGRVVSHYPPNYMRMWAPPKPRYIKNNDTFQLIESPIKKKQDIFKLLDNDFINDLNKYDYWAGYYKETLNAPSNLTWPAFYTITKHFNFFVFGAKTKFLKFFNPNYETDIQTYKYYHLYQNPTEALAILQYIIEQFVQLANLRKETPIILIFPDQYSLDIIKKYDRIPYLSIIQFLQKKEFAYIDFGEIFIKDGYSEYYKQYNGHYSPKGNKRVADEFIKLINQLDTLKK